jgi:membrane-associated phospholipid phosphatase
MSRAAAALEVACAPPASRRRWVLTAGIAGTAIAVARLRGRLGVPRLPAAIAAVSAPVSFALLAPRGRARCAGTWTLQMWAYKVLFELPNEEPWRLRHRLHIDYPVRVDRVLGGGVPLTQRMQSLRDVKRTSALDVALTIFYLTWEVEPHLVLAWLLLRHPDRFSRAAFMLGATIDLTLVGYWLVPTAPPWWASQVGGRMDGAVRRVFTETRRVLRGRPRVTGQDTRGANPWASMPSDHFASSAMTAMLLGDLGPVQGAAGWAYALALGCTLVYLGEHYVVDLLAGLGLAVSVRTVAPRLLSAARSDSGSFLSPAPGRATPGRHEPVQGDADVRTPQHP